MWVMTPYGYTSAVAHKRKPRHLMIRARDMRSLEYFCDFAGMQRNLIYSDFPSDYPYRVVCKRRTYKKFLLASADDIGYTNFKSRAGQVRPSWVGGTYKQKKGKGKWVGGTSTGDKYTSFLSDVWASSHVLTPADTKKENDKAWSKHWPVYSTGTAGSGSIGARWRDGGAWADFWDNPVTEKTEGDWPTVADLLDMPEEDRSDILTDMSIASSRGDVDAEDVLDEYDRLSLEPPEHVDISSMTDDEFAKFEAGETSI